MRSRPQQQPGELGGSPSLCCFRLDAVVCGDAYATPAADDQQEPALRVLLVER